MTLAEFKAWLEGFTESMDGAPDEKQWKRIKARVKEIDGVAITKTVFVDRYVDPYFRRHWWEQPLVSYGVSAANTGMHQCHPTGDTFNSHSAMMDLGKADYSRIAAA